MNHLVHGKNDTKHIVCIEVIDDGTEIFFEKDGVLSTEIVPNNFWILSNKQHNPSWVRLKGDLHYKFGKKYDKASEYYKAKSIMRKMNVDFFTISDPKESFMVKNGYTYFKGLEQKDVSVLSFDIETTGLNHDESSKVLIISNTLRKNGKVERRLFCYDDYEDEGQMIVDWCNWVREVDPTIILGHNIYMYDFPYLNYIAQRHGVELILGRNDSPIVFFNYESQKRIDGSRDQAYHKLRIYGREVVDTMFLAINYDIATKKYESYALKKIIAQENLEVEGRQFYDAGTIRNNYLIPEEWEKIKLYALHDADDALALYDLMSPSFFYLTQSVPKSFQGIVESASGSQLNAMMVRAYIQEGHSIPKDDPIESFEGAISMGVPGIYRNCFKVDVASLYPSIMIHYEVYNKEKDPKAYMLEMVKTFTAERLKNKKLAKETKIKYYDDMQNAQKIVINSFYGFLGAAGLQFNSFKDAAFVTEKGREILQTATIWATGNKLVQVPTKKKKKNGELKYEWIVGPKVSEGNSFQLVNADTDSITITLNGDELDDDHQKTILDHINSLFPERIKFENDGYYKTIIVFRAKNYVLFDGKKIKTKGSALKDAKKEKALKEFLNRIIQTIIEGNENYTEIYNEYVNEAYNIKDISRWSSKKTISSKVLNNDRTNEVNIRNAIEGEEIVEGDKIYVYYKADGSLSLSDKFNGDYDKEKMLEKVFKTSKVFNSIINPELFINYKLKKNQKLLHEIVSK